MRHFVNRACQFIGMPESQRKSLIGYFISLLLLILIALIPVRKYYDSNKMDYIDQLRISIWLENNLGGIPKDYAIENNIKKNPKSKSGKSLFSIISETGNKTMLSRIEKRGSTVVVTIDKARLSELLNWLGEISDQQGIEVQNTVINYIEGDRINAQITFSQ